MHRECLFVELNNRMICTKMIHVPLSSSVFIPYVVHLAKSVCADVECVSKKSGILHIVIDIQSSILMLQPARQKLIAD